MSVADRVQKKVQNEFPFFKGTTVAALEIKQKHGTAIAIIIDMISVLALK